eukprot:g65350.t1
MIHLLLSLTAAVAQPPIPSAADKNIVRSAIIDLLESGREDILSVQLGDQSNFASKLARLSFHDCVGPNGCDGCLNLASIPDNKGLESIVDVLHALYITGGVKNVMSRADLIAFAGAVALQRARPGDLDLTSNFVFGRPDNKLDCPGDSFKTTNLASTYNAGEFPAGEGGFANAFAVLGQKMGSCNQLRVRWALDFDACCFEQEVLLQRGFRAVDS